MNKFDADTHPHTTDTSASGGAAHQSPSNHSNEPNQANQANQSAANAGASGAPARPRRRASSRSRAGQTSPSGQAAATANEPATTPSATAEAQHPSQPERPAERPAEHAQPAPTATPEATPAPARTSTRTHRPRGGRGKRNAVSVVLPAAPEAATDEASSAAAAVRQAEETGHPVADAALAGTAQPEIVSAREIQAEEATATTPPAYESPAVSALLNPATPAANESMRATTAPAETAQPQAPVAAGATSRRYRFERRTPATLHRPAAPVRPERLSGRLAESHPGAPTLPAEQTPGEDLAAEHAPAAEAMPSRAPVVQVEPAAEARAHEVAAPPAVTFVGEASAEQRVESAAEETHEAAARRRRRRRRRPESEETEAHGEQPETAAAQREGGNGFAAVYGEPDLEEGYPPYAPYVPGAGGPIREAIVRAQPQSPNWTISQAQQQISQAASPFGAPEPSFSRGFGPQPRGVAQPYHESLTRPRTEREAPAISTSQLAQAMSSAIAQQTDRLVTELRRQVTTPPAITVAMPPMQTTERVGVFVDVANLLYSARNMRMGIDFGRLLEFLRGSRRLIRAHAYAPTSPEPNAEQAFLSAVKGVGYRITTKNYKTFSSGAKKADLDLDMCMDIVRLVDASAIDTLVLVSGDSDFLPVLEWASDKGVRIEVAAFEDAVSAILRQSCDLFINLSLVPDIRA
jgi:uncharacterized LabA/DUF88 family protein